MMHKAPQPRHGASKPPCKSTKQRLHKKFPKSTPRRSMALTRVSSGVQSIADAEKRRDDINNIAKNAVAKIKQQQEELYNALSQKELSQARKTREERYMAQPHADEAVVKHVQLTLLGVLETDADLRRVFHEAVNQDGVSSVIHYQGYSAIFNHLSTGAMNEVASLGKTHQFTENETAEFAATNFLGLFQVYSQQGSSLEPVFLDTTQRYGPRLTKLFAKCNRILPWEDLLEAHWDIVFEAAFGIQPDQRRKMKQTLTQHEARQIWMEQVELLSDGALLDEFNTIRLKVNPVADFRNVEAQIEYVAQNRQILSDILSQRMTPMYEKMHFHGTPGFFHLQKALEEHIFDGAVNDAFTMVEGILETLQRTGANMPGSHFARLVAINTDHDNAMEFQDVLQKAQNYQQTADLEQQQQPTSSSPPVRKTRIVRSNAGGMPPDFGDSRQA